MTVRLQRWGGGPGQTVPPSLSLRKEPARHASTPPDGAGTARFSKPPVRGTWRQGA